MPEARYNNTVSMTIETQGDTGTASQVRIRLMQHGNQHDDQVAVRVWLCNEGAFANSTNATLAPITNKGTTLTTHTANKDLTIRSDDDLPGEVWVTVTDATAETVTLRVGPGATSCLAADYTVTLDVTHAAP